MYSKESMVLLKDAAIQYNIFSFFSKGGRWIKKKKKGTNWDTNIGVKHT